MINDAIYSIFIERRDTHTHTHTHANAHTHQLQIALDGSTDSSSGGGIYILIKAGTIGEEDTSIGRG